MRNASKRFYFAYGSNLNREGMGSRCPDSIALCSATLDGWTLTFRGVADIERRDGDRTHGALWRISERDLARLDRYEGYPSLYRRETVQVQFSEGEVGAITYVMNDDYLGLPSPSYLGSIQQGYEQWSLPLLDLDLAVAEVKNRLYDRGIWSFEPDGPKRLRPANRTRGDAQGSARQSSTTRWNPPTSRS